MAAAANAKSPVRLAIGSSRWRIVRQLMTEGALIATAAGVAGVILARWGVAFFTATSPNAVAGRDSRDYASLAAFAEPAIDLRVLGFAVVLAVATTMIFALAPAISAARPGSGSGAERQRPAAAARAFGGLIVAEVALAVSAARFSRTCCSKASPACSACVSASIPIAW